MKKSLLISMVFLASYNVFSQSIDTLAAWTFPTGIDSLDIYPDVSIPNNANYYISAEDTVTWPNTTLRDISSTAGLTTFAGTVANWDNGSETKLWSIKIKAPGYSHIKVSSKHYSDTQFPGPKDWKIQARFSGEDWVELENGSFVCGNDWTTGVVSNVELPAEFNNPGNTSIFIRWIMTSNLNTAGGNVEPSGISKIDDVVITGELPAGTGDIRIDDPLQFYPNPVETGRLFFESDPDLTLLNIYSFDGRLIMTRDIIGLNSVNIGGLNPGIYFIEPVYSQSRRGFTEKLIIR